MAVEEGVGAVVGQATVSAEGACICPAVGSVVGQAVVSGVGEDETLLHTLTSQEGNTFIALWETMTQANNIGDPHSELPGASDRSVQVIGTFGGSASMAIQGSNEAAVAVTWQTLHDVNGDDLTFTAAGIQMISENVSHIRPLLSLGDGTTDLDVLVFSRGTR